MGTINKFINLGITVFKIFIFCGIASSYIYGSARFTQISNLGPYNQIHISLNDEYSYLKINSIFGLLMRS